MREGANVQLFDSDTDRFCFNFAPKSCPYFIKRIKREGEQPPHFRLPQDVSVGSDHKPAPNTGCMFKTVVSIKSNVHYYLQCQCDYIYYISKWLKEEIPLKYFSQGYITSI